MANTYDLTQTGSEVQAILNDANNIKGAGAQTTLTTDYILLKDTNGQYHKILKDSFTEACRNVLAGLLVNNDKGTTISQIAAIASYDFGSITPANLASVLGVGFVVSGAVTPGNSYSFTVKSGYVLLWITERSGRGYAILTQGNQATPIYSTPGTVANLTGISYTRSGDIHTITLTNNDTVNLNWRVKIIDDIV